MHKPIRTLVVVLALLAGCSDEPAPLSVAPPGTAVADLRILSLGDSYTCGEGVSPESAFPEQLAQRLGDSGVEVAASVVLAETGWTTTKLLAAIGTPDATSPYGLVTLLIGVNNQHQGLEFSRFETEFAALLDHAVSRAGGRADRVVVLSLPDWGVTPFGEQFGQVRVSREIDQYNAECLRQASERGVHYVDITRVSRRVPDEPDLLCRDGIHPSQEQYAEWVKLLLPVALGALRD